MIRLLKFLLLLIPFLSCIVLFIHKAIHDPNILNYFNYAFYALSFVISFIFLLIIFSFCFLLAYKAFLVLFNIKSLTIDKH
jgi:hypothetical protein